MYWRKNLVCICTYVCVIYVRMCNALRAVKGLAWSTPMCTQPLWGCIWIFLIYTRRKNINKRKEIQKVNIHSSAETHAILYSIWILMHCLFKQNHMHEREICRDREYEVGRGLIIIGSQRNSQNLVSTKLRN